MRNIQDHALRIRQNVSPYMNVHVCHFKAETCSDKSVSLKAKLLSFLYTCRRLPKRLLLILSIR